MTAGCGHGPLVSLGRCWDCHLTILRLTGRGARAERLVELRRQQDEGRFDLTLLAEGMVEMYGEIYAALRAESADL